MSFGMVRTDSNASHAVTVSERDLILKKPVNLNPNLKEKWRKAKFKLSIILSARCDK
jgi:hypothetical protein